MNKKKIELLVKAMVKDKARLNRLAGYTPRYDQQDIDSAMELTLLDINRKNVPYTNYSIEDAPERLMIIGTAAKIMACDNILKASNYISINDGNVTMNREENVKLLIQISREMSREFDISLGEYKHQMNIGGAWGN